MSNSTTKPGQQKPTRPDGYPLFAHANGLWAKKVKGKLWYFGSWSDPGAALEKWLREKDDLLAGRDPRRDREPDALTLAVLVNNYLLAKQSDIAIGEYSARSFRNAFLSCERMIQQFGQHRLVTDLRQEDFAGYRKFLVEKEYSPSTIRLEIAICKALFHWAYATELIERPVRFGPQFRGISNKSAKRQNGKTPPKMFEPAELKTLIDAAKPQLKAMILLGVNAGFGNTDCGQLPKTALDLKGGWIEFPRPKTGVDRKCWLWPETVQALREAIRTRPKLTDDEKYIVWN